MTPINKVKSYLKNHPTLSHMLDGGKFEIHDHDSTLDKHIIQHLDEVSEEHLSEKGFQTVTVTKDIKTEDGLAIPKIVKIQLSENNNIESVLESK